MIYKMYQEMKEDYPNKIVLIRVGDFYEAFEEDAKELAEVCNLYLATRNLGEHGLVPMAGFPYWGVRTYTKMLMHADKRCVLFELEGKETYVQRES